MIDSSLNDFINIRNALKDGAASTKRTGRPAFDRLLSALVGQVAHSPRTGLDLAVLFRHALRYEMVRRSALEIPPEIVVPHRDGMPTTAHWHTVGMCMRASEHGNLVNARPWQPDWLLPGNEAADLRAVLETPMRQIGSEHHSPDPFLRKVGKKQYRSPGQRVAVRAALTTPPGGTLLITLPTGEGKSLVFESLGLFGNDSGLPSVTPVIVPTVALAIDHEKSIQQRLGTDRPFAYVGGSSSRSALFEAIRSGVQGLCFMAPETACGPLYEPLLQAARERHLGAFIIDEAHLVEAWGTDFRTHFPLLSALRRRMIAETAPEILLRTVLLSATLTQMAVDTLESLFADQMMGVVNGACLRTELHFFTALMTNEDVRRNRVLEAVAHLPRPLILYASTRSEVDAWHTLLRKTGYGNLAQFHGGTSTGDRDRILDAWRDGSLDMVVGNSAFGLGIDYAHVRSVVHACMPETLDRFYQEVGRGGRDGRSSVSVLIPAYNDRNIARSLNKKKIISLKRGRQRWQSMFQNPDRKTLGWNRYAIRLNVSPSNEQQDLDMVGLRSVDWNDRILTVMARVGLIRILDRYDDKETGYPWAHVEVLQHDHNSEAAWEKIDHLRRAIHSNNARNLGGMERYINAIDCPAPLLAEIYTTDRFTELEHIIPVCSGCPVCGNSGNGLKSDSPTPAYPWGIGITVASELASLFDHNRLLIVEYRADNLHSTRFQRELKETLKSLQVYGFTNLFILGPDGVELEERVLEFEARNPFFISRGTSWPSRSLLPSGPDLVFMLPNFRQMTSLGVNPNGERLIFIPDTLRDPSRPDCPFLDTYSGNSTRFDPFRIKVRL